MTPTRIVRGWLLCMTDCQNENKDMCCQRGVLAGMPAYPQLAKESANRLRMLHLKTCRHAWNDCFACLARRTEQAADIATSKRWGIKEVLGIVQVVERRYCRRQTKAL